ncbi:MAG: RES domain-containing protein [Spirosomataceae bacterium]|jgi:RES domain-containing protein
MIVYRLTKGKYKNEISGIGAELYGGRWNNKGTRIIYTGESRALCTTEIAVHTPLGIIPHNYYVQTIKLPVVEILEIEADELTDNWRSFPHNLSTKKTGDEFIKNDKYLLLKVPSAVIQDEYNYLINPFHSEYSKVELIKVEKFQFDKRLFGK